MNLDPYPSAYIKIHFKQTIGLNVNGKATQLLADHPVKWLHDLEVGEDFLNSTQEISHNSAHNINNISIKKTLRK